MAIGSIKFCVFGVALFLFGFVVISNVDARERIRFRGLGLAKGEKYSGGPVLSRDDLRVCVGQKNSIDADVAELDEMDVVIKRKSSEINGSEAKIARVEQSIDRYSQAAIDSFNLLVDKHKKLVAEYNELVNSYNVKVDLAKSKQNSFNFGCAGHAYYTNDMQAIINEGK